MRPDEERRTDEDSASGLFSQWRAEARTNPVKAVWSALIFVLGVQALLSLTQIVVQAKGFVIELLAAYQLIWQEPLAAFAGLLGIHWPAWASDLMAAYSAMGVAAHTVVERVRSESALVRERLKEFIPAPDYDDDEERKEFLPGELSLTDRPRQLLHLHWNWYHRVFFPFALLRLHLWDRSWRAEEKAHNALLRDIAEVLPGRGSVPELPPLISVSIFRLFRQWLLAVVLAAVSLLLISYALFYLPTPSR